MTSRTIKVDRVFSAAEAAELESLGAGVIGVDLDPDPRFPDHRTVSLDETARIRRELSRARLAVALDLRQHPAEVLRRARQSGADLVQPITRAVPPRPVRAALREAGLGIVYAGIEINHDDDPGWVFSAYDDEPDLNAALFQVEVLPEYAGSWAFLRDRSPEFEEEFQIGDLDELARDRPVVAGLDLGPDNLAEITSRLPRLRGLSMTLAETAARTGVHFHSFEAAAAVLRVSSTR